MSEENKELDNLNVINNNTDSETKLTSWENEPSVEELKEDLDSAKILRNTAVNRINKWNDLRNVTGEAKIKEVKGRSSVQPKLIKRQAEWRYSALSEPFLSSNKLYQVNPRTFEDAKAAEQNELVLNWQMDTKLNKVKFIDEYVRTCVDEGTVVVRLGWKRETKTEKIKNPIFSYTEITDQQHAEQLQQAINLKEENPREFNKLTTELIAAVEYYEATGAGTIVSITGYQDADKEVITKNEPTIHIVNINNIYVDPTCLGNYEEASFVVYSYDTSKAELKKDKRFKNLDKINWENSSILSEPDHSSFNDDTENFNDNLRKKIVAYEYWGLYDISGEGRLEPIIATWVNNIMVRMERNPFPDEKPPFVFATYLPIKESIYGEADAEILEDNQKISGAITRGMIDLTGRSANSQQGMAKGFLDATNRRKFHNGFDYEFNSSTGGPAVSVYQHKYPEIPNSALTILQMQNQEAESLSGVKSFSGGVSGASYGDVAVGIRGALDAASKREMNILRRLAKGINDIGSKIAAMNSIFLKEKEVVRITNSKFVEINREDLKGNFDLLVDISTAEIDDLKAKDLGFMLQTVGPAMPPEYTSMILADIATLKRMPELAHKIETYEPKPDPLVEEMKKLEIEKLKAEIENINSDTEYNKSRAFKAETDGVKNKVETENEISGVTHQRDLQKSKEQSKGNQNLEVTKSLLRGTKEGESKPDIEGAIGFNYVSDKLNKTN